MNGFAERDRLRQEIGKIWIVLSDQYSHLVRSFPVENARMFRPVHHMSWLAEMIEMLRSAPTTGCVGKIERERIANKVKRTGSRRGVCEHSRHGENRRRLLERISS